MTDHLRPLLEGLPMATVAPLITIPYAPIIFYYAPPPGMMTFAAPPLPAQPPTTYLPQGVSLHNIQKPWPLRPTPVRPGAVERLLVPPVASFAAAPPMPRLPPQASSSLTPVLAALALTMNDAGPQPPSEPMPKLDLTAPAAVYESAPKIFACSVYGCGDSFNTKFSLTRHGKKHTGERPFPCTYKGCGKRFAERSTLARHARIHTGVKLLTGIHRSS